MTWTLPKNPSAGAAAVCCDAPDCTAEIPYIDLLLNIAGDWHRHQHGDYCPAHLDVSAKVRAAYALEQAFGALRSR